MVLVVISALYEFATSLQAGIQIRLGREMDIQQLAGYRTGTPAGKPLHKDVEVHIDEYRRIQRPADAGEHAFQRSGLGEIARIAIEHEAGSRVVLLQSLANDSQHDVVGNQFPRSHCSLGVAPKLMR